VERVTKSTEKTKIKGSDTCKKKNLRKRNGKETAEKHRRSKGTPGEENSQKRVHPHLEKGLMALRSKSKGPARLSGLEHKK